MLGGGDGGDGEEEGGEGGGDDDTMEDYQFSRTDRSVCSEFMCACVCVCVCVCVSVCVCVFVYCLCLNHYKINFIIKLFKYYLGYGDFCLWL